MFLDFSILLLFYHILRSILLYTKLYAGVLSLRFSASLIVTKSCIAVTHTQINLPVPVIEIFLILCSRHVFLQHFHARVFLSDVDLDMFGLVVCIIVT